MASSGGSSSDESVNPRSEIFDCLKALYSGKTKVPVANAPVYDNVQKFESVLKGRAILPGKTSKKTSSATDENDISKQKIKPHPAGDPRHARYPEKNFLSKMQKMFGPLGMLYKYMEERTRVKVYTRNAAGIRGHIVAYVAAFDKHWNLALEDCFEEWSRKVKRKAPALGDRVHVEVPEEVPKVTVVETNGKLETLKRHVPQMILRGEQVAIIVKIN